MPTVDRDIFELARDYGAACREVGGDPSAWFGRVMVQAVVTTATNPQDPIPSDEILRCLWFIFCQECKL